ncbi:MAG: hypothetical protein K2G24_02430 [Muribaculaceae bacterium]|nr:hypothetical protein [Muribaculaceae bacterium]
MSQSVVSHCIDTDIAGYTHYLLMKAQLAGNFTYDGHKASGEELEIARECRSLITVIEKQLALCADEHIPELLECYDMAYRTGFGRMPDSTFTAGHIRRLYKAWKNGNRHIEESVIFGIGITCCDADCSATHDSMKKKWLGTLSAYDYFPDTTAAENYQRLALMMREDIGADDMNIKSRWYNHNRIDDFASVGTYILRSYRRYATSLFPDVLTYDSMAGLDRRILSELSSRSDLGPHDREAFRIALECNS